MNILQQHLASKNWDAALACYDNLLKTHWDSNLAMSQTNVLINTGKVQQAFNLLETILTHDPTNTDALFSRDFYNLFTSPTAAWEPLLRTIGNRKLNLLQQLLFLQFRLIYMWVSGKPTDDIHAVCDIADTLLRPWSGDIIARRQPANVSAMVAGNMFSLASFLSTIRALNFIQDGNRQRKPQYPALVMMGDSHVLAPHGKLVMWEGTLHQVQSEVITGIKAWHVAQPSRYQYAQYLFARIRHIPTPTPIVFSFGEIDCRYNQGIWPHIRKGQRISNILQNTFPPAITTLAPHLQDRSWGVAGIPAPHIDEVIKLPQPEWESFGAMVAAANTCYQQAVTSAGGTYVNLYAFTADEVGIRTPEWDLDRIHLKPATLGCALEGQATTSQTTA